MNYQLKAHIHSIASLSFVLTVLTIGSMQTGVQEAPRYSEVFSARIGSTRAFTAAEKRFDSALTMNERIAKRMQRRLRDSGSRAAPPINKLISAVEQRQELLGRKLNVTFEGEDDVVSEPWSVSLQRYPLWLRASITLTSASFIVEPSEIAKTIEQESVVSLPVPEHAVLRDISWSEEEDTVHRAVIEGVAKPGYLPDLENVSTTITAALIAGDTEEVAVPVALTQGRIINMTGEDLGDLRLWATGRSNFKGSTYARKANVRKALHEHVTNTVVRPGEKFVFNDTLDGPVSQGNGWHMAKVIFNGGDLEYAPGGGICQASTTAYRAAVLAGFPVTERRAHSLYVSYYKEHGVGIDATIYPGTQDMVFENDSENVVLVQSYTDGDEAYVNVFGTPDGRTVTLEGPYFTATAPDGFTYKGRHLKTNEIAWVQKVTYTDGRQVDTVIGSTYRTLPQNLVYQYPPQQQFHAAAPDPLAKAN